MNDIILFHLHFYTKYYKEYENFFVSKLGFTIKGRFAKDIGLIGSELSWKDIETQGMKLRLVEIQKGAVNIVLMPAKFEEAKLEHFGLLLSKSKFEYVIKKANELGLQVRESPNRTFISSKLGFRLEVHSVDKIDRDLEDELFIEGLKFSTDQPDEFKRLFFELLEIEIEENSFRMNKSKVELVNGKFSLKSFKLNGKGYSNNLEDRVFLKGLPIEL